MADPLGSTLRATVDEGLERLGRTWPALLATGMVGGIDVSLGVLANLLLTDQTGSSVIGALGFTIGFIALTLGNSELFTENFLVPVAAATTSGVRGWRDVGRLWIGTSSMNIVGGTLVMALALVALPELADTAAEKGRTYTENGVSWTGLASSILAGVVITVMTWMQQGARQPGARAISAIAAGFLLAYSEVSHVIVASLEVLAGVIGGQADYAFVDWLGQVWLWAVGNAIGGMGLVTVLRLVQLGRARIEEQSQRTTHAEAEEEQGDSRPDQATPTRSGGRRAEGAHRDEHPTRGRHEGTRDDSASLDG